ncbi:MAG: AAA family ATPase [Stappiaceae bacterium]
MVAHNNSNHGGTGNQRRLFIVPEIEDKMMGFGDILALLRRRLLLIVVVVLLGTAAAFVAATSLPDSFKASSTLVLGGDGGPQLGSELTASVKELNHTAFETEISIMRSRGFAGQIVDEFDLVNDPYLNSYLKKPEDEQTDGLSEFVGSTVKTVKSFLGLDAGDSTPIAPPEPAVQRDRTISKFLSKMTIGRSGESRAMSVTVSHSGAENAAGLANSIADFYVRRSFERIQNDNISAIAILRGRAENLAESIAESEGRISDLQRIHQLDGTNDKVGDQIQAESSQLDIRLKIANSELDKSEEQLQKIDQALDDRTTDFRPAEADPAFAALLTHKAEEAALLKDKVRLAQVGEAGQPELLRANARLESIREKIRLEVGRLKSVAIGKIQQNELTIAKLKTQSDSLKARIRERSKAKIELSKLDRQLLTDRDRYTQLTNSLGELDLKAEVLSPTSRVVSRAEIPIEPAAPKRKTIVAAGFVGSAILGLVLALLFEGLNKKLRTDQQTRQISKLPNLAYVPQIPSKLFRKPLKPHQYLAENSHSFFSEAIRSLYLGCRRSINNNPPKVVMVTSGLPSEGKSSISISLAAIAAVNGQRTALVDLDLHRSGVSEALGFRGLDGSIEHFIEDSRPINEIVHQHDALPGVDVICATTKLQQRSSLLASDRLLELFKELRRDYDFVVVDTPPILVVNDASWAAPLTDIAITVVRWGETTENVLRDSVSRLNMDKVPLVGTVINRVNPRIHAKSGYGGSLAYYGYAEGYYSQ